MSLGQFLLEEKFVWVGGFEGKFSVSFGPNPEFRLWIWTWTKLSNIFSKVYYMFNKLTDFSNGGRFVRI